MLAEYLTDLEEIEMLFDLPITPKQDLKCRICGESLEVINGNLICLSNFCKDFHRRINLQRRIDCQL